jgi:hypothetical protein
VTLIDRLRAEVRAQHEADVAAGRGAVALPGQLRIKYPRAPWEWGWQWVFPATRWYVDRQTGETRRHHLHESVVQRAVKEAVRASGDREDGDLPRFGTRLRLTSWSRVMTSGPFKSYSAIGT